MTKIMYDGRRADKNLKLIVRIICLGILAIAFFMGFIHNPHENKDAFTNENLWEAVHPFQLWDIFGIAGMIFYALYVCGLAGKVVYAWAEPKSARSTGMIHVIFAVSVLSIILMYSL